MPLNSLSGLVTNPETLRLILESHPEADRLALVKEKNELGETVLHLAAKNPESLDLILTLLPEVDRLVALTAKDNQGDTVLHLAESLDRIIARLPEADRLAAATTKNSWGQTLLHWAAGNPASVGLILALLPEADRLVAVTTKDGQDEMALHLAANCPESLRQLLALLPEADRLVAMTTRDGQGQTGLHCAVNHRESLRLLLEVYPEADRLAAVTEKNNQGQTALDSVANNPEFLRLLFALIPGADRLLDLLPEAKRLAAVTTKDEQGHTVLHYAADSSESLRRLFDLLLEADRLAAVTTKNSLGETVLHWAAKNPESLHLLLDLYPDTDRLAAVTEKNKRGETTVHLAINNLESLRCLFDLLPEANRLAAVTAKDNQGWAALHLAINYPDSLLLLLALLPQAYRLAAVTTKDNQGQTVLHWAAKKPEFLRSLLDLLPEANRLAAVTTKDNRDQTVLHLVANNPITLSALLRVFPALDQEELSDDLLTRFSDSDNLLSLSSEEPPMPIGVLALNIAYTLNKVRAEYGEQQKLTDSYAGDNDRINKSEERYQAVLGQYEQQFIGSHEASLEKVEQNLKRDLLHCIRDNTQNHPKDSAAHQELLNLLTKENIERLAANSDVNLAQKARDLLTSNDDIYHIAWRAYDARTQIAGWDNLFVAPTEPTQHKDVHGGDNGNISLQEASQETRKRAAMYYLTAADDSTNELKDSKTDRLNAFFSSVAECRRAHNTGEAGDAHNTLGDNPSCYPGTITRLSYSILSHPLFKEESNPEELVRLKVQAMAENTLRTFLSSGRSAEEKAKIYAAVLMLGINNIQEVLFTPRAQLKQLSIVGDEFDLNELTQYRALFLNAMDIGEVLLEVTKYLGDKNINVSASLCNFYVIKALLDLGGLHLSLTHEDRLQLGFTPTQPQEGAAAAASGEVRIEEEQFPEPPPVEKIMGCFAYQRADVQRNQEEKNKILYEQHYQPLLFRAFFLALQKYIPALTSAEIGRFILNEFASPKPSDKTTLNALFHNPSERVETIFSKYNESNPPPAALTQGLFAKTLVVRAMNQVIEKHGLDVQEESIYSSRMQSCGG